MTSRKHVDLNKPLHPGDLWIDRTNCWAIMPKYSDQRYREYVTFTPAMRTALIQRRQAAGLTPEDLAFGVGYRVEWIRRLEIGSVSHIVGSDFDALLDYCVAAADKRGRAA